MGLAASQARFLLLSSRQSDVELRMQSITNQKLALQRQSGDIATKYQRAMNASSLFWNDKSINYNTITNPTNSAQYMITNSYGAVVLDSHLAGLLNDPALSGVSGSGAEFESLYPNAEKFMKAISGSTLESPDCQTAIKENEEAQKKKDEQDNAYKPGEITVNYNDHDLITNCGTAISGAYKDNEPQLLLKENIAKEITLNEDEMGSDSGTAKVLIEENYDKIRDAYAKFDEIFLGSTGDGGFAGLLKDGYYRTLCYGKDGGSGPMKDNAAIVEAACDYAANATRNQFLYGYYDTDATNSEDDTFIAKEYYEHLHEGTTLWEIRQDEIAGDDEHINRGDADEEKNLNTIDFWAKEDSGSSDMGDQKTLRATANFQVYPKEIIETYMNYFDMYMEQNYGSAEGVTVGNPNLTEKTKKTIVTPQYTDKDVEKERKSYKDDIKNDPKYKGYTTETFDGTHTVVTTHTYSEAESNSMVDADVDAHIEAWKTEHTKVFEAPTGYTSTRKEYGGTNSVALDGTSSVSKASAKAQYYMKLYNALCSSGWVTDSQVNNSNYLENQLMYGNYVVGKLSSYVRYNEISVTDSYTPFTIEDDKEAADRAKLEYEAERDALDYKEALLDAQLDSLTTEREEITTEKESVQALIDENVKKFKLFA